MFSRCQSSQQKLLLEAVASRLTATERAIAATTCTSLAAAFKVVTTKLKLQAAQDLCKVAVAADAAQYPNLVLLHVEPKAAVASDHLPALLSSLPRLQELRLTAPPAATPRAVQRYSFLNDSLSTLIALTRLSLQIPSSSKVAAVPLPSLSSLSSLQDLCLGGELAARSLPTGITTLRLHESAGTNLSHVSSCIHLQGLQLVDAYLPEGWEGDSGMFWAALRPLTALTAIVGTLDYMGEFLGDPCWTEVGSGAPDSLPVVQRLNQLCLGEPCTMLPGITVNDRICSKGTLTIFTNLEMLWLDCPKGTPPLGESLPLGLRQLRLRGAADIRRYTNLTSLTLEVKEGGRGMSVNQMPTSLQELSVVHHEDHKGCLGLRSFARLPRLQRCSCWAPTCCFTPEKVREIVRLGPQLAHVHMYVVPDIFHDYTASEVAEVAAMACGGLKRAPKVQVSQLQPTDVSKGFWEVEYTIDDVVAAGEEIYEMKLQSIRRNVLLGKKHRKKR